MFKRCLIVLSSPVAASYRLMAGILEGVNEIRSLATICLMLSSHSVVSCLGFFFTFFFFSITMYKLVMEISWDLMAEISFKNNWKLLHLGSSYSITDTFSSFSSPAVSQRHFLGCYFPVLNDLEPLPVAPSLPGSACASLALYKYACVLAFAMFLFLHN